MKKEHPQKCTCVYCEEELKRSCIEPAFCLPCTVEAVTCAACGKKFPAEKEACPYCGKKHARKKK